MKFYKIAITLAALPFISINASANAPSKEPEACHLKPKQVVTAFVNELYIENKPHEALETWVAEDYVQHNPMAPNGRAAVEKFFDEYSKNPAFANMKSDVRRIIADGDLVAVHSHATNGPNDPGFVVVDIWRVEGCKIVEHWDVMQKVPEQSANGNTMY